jgi:hypothetical protein
LGWQSGEGSSGLAVCSGATWEELYVSEGVRRGVEADGKLVGG